MGTNPNVNGRAAEVGAFFLKTVGAFALITLAFLVLLYLYPRAEVPEGKLMSIESYVSQNISELSPEKAVLGGTFYVTEIQVADGKGTVEYEDGHIARCGFYLHGLRQAGHQHHIIHCPQITSGIITAWSRKLSHSSISSKTVFASA